MFVPLVFDVSGLFVFYLCVAFVLDCLFLLLFGLVCVVVYGARLLL